MIRQVRRRPSRGNIVHSSGRCRTKRRKRLNNNSVDQLWRQFNEYCNTAKGEDQIHAKSLLKRTQSIEPSPTNKYRVQGTLKTRGRSNLQRQQDKAAARKFNQFLLFQQFTVFCDDEEGEDQVQAFALRNRTLYIEPSRTHANKIDGKFKGKGRSARQKKEDKQIISKFRNWMQDQGAEEHMESNEEELVLTNWEREKLKQDEWHKVTQGVKIKLTKSTPVQIPTSNKYSPLSDLSSATSVPPEVDIIVRLNSVENDKVETKGGTNENKCKSNKKRKLKKLRERAKKLQLNNDEEAFLERAN